VHDLLALTWDPQIRGAVILLAAILILPGSVYLLLLTNLGARLGFLVTVAGLAGWMMLLSLLWTLTPSGTGPKGRDPRWVVKSAVTGPVGATAPPALAEFPRGGWKSLAEGEAERAEAQTAADEFFTKSEEGKAQFGFTETSDYIPLNAYAKGGQEHHLFGVEIQGKGLTYAHDAHFTVVQVQPNKNAGVQVAAGQTPPAPEPDESKPVVTILLERDLGTRRLPPFLVFVSSTTIFVITALAMHRRDRLAARLRAAAAPA
jgi:hypothetical protein